MPPNTAPTNKKLQLKRNRSYTKTLQRWGTSIVGLALLLSLLLFGFSYVRGSDAGQFHLENPVGTDLMVKRSPDHFTRTAAKKIEASPDPSPYPTLNQYQVGSVVPRQSRQKIIRGDKDELEYITHEVREGENVWKIAQRYGLKTYTVVSANYKRLSQRGYLPVGMELKIPNRNGILTELKKDQTLWDLMQTYGLDHRQVLKFNNIKSASQISEGEKIFIPGAHPVNPYKYQLQHEGKGNFSWPVSPGRRRITSRFGDRDHPIFDRMVFHRGIDIGAKPGSAVFAARAGVVTVAGVDEGYGKVIILKHGQNYRTLYAHLRRRFVRKGQYVQKGQRIGEIGQTGFTTGPNLHFEVRKGDKAIDPLKFIQ